MYTFFSFKTRLHSFLPYYYSVDGKCKDGFTYVLYINGGHPPWGLLYPFFFTKFIYFKFYNQKIFIFHNFFALIIFIIGAKLCTRTFTRRTGTRSWSTGYREVCKPYMSEEWTTLLLWDQSQILSHILDIRTRDHFSSRLWFEFSKELNSNDERIKNNWVPYYINRLF